MLTTTLAKPVTMQLNMPDKTDTKETSPVKLSETLTVIPDEFKVYYYQGIPTEAGTKLEVTDYSETGIRKVIADLKKKIGKFMTKGNLPGLDGRRVWIRSEHAALNTLLQSAGAIIAKQWLVEATKGIAEAGIDAKLVAFVHDETQWEVDVAHAQQAVEIIEAAATKAGEMLQFRCPVDAEGKIGNNWRECH
jgi:DNA polymerase I-like protein with 3'-5' exonuclease and polymerase domains